MGQVSRFQYLSLSTAQVLEGILDQQIGNIYTHSHRGALYFGYFIDSCMLYGSMYFLIFIFPTNV